MIMSDIIGRKSSENKISGGKANRCVCRTKLDFSRFVLFIMMMMMMEA
jgi:hypothetical protein